MSTNLEFCLNGRSYTLITVISLYYFALDYIKKKKKIAQRFTDGKIYDTVLFSQTVNNTFLKL